MTRAQAKRRVQQRQAIEDAEADATAAGIRARNWNMQIRTSGINLTAPTVRATLSSMGPATAPLDRIARTIARQARTAVEAHIDVAEQRERERLAPAPVRETRRAQENYQRRLEEVEPEVENYVEELSARYSDIGVAAIDMTPNDYRDFYIRQNGGALMTFALMERMSGFFAAIGMAFIRSVMLEPDGEYRPWTNDMFWQVAMVDDNNAVLDSSISFDLPTQERLKKAIDALNDGETSDSGYNAFGVKVKPGSGGPGQRMELSGNRIVVTVYTPIVGGCGKLPKHLVGKTKTAWSTDRDHCMPRSVAVALSKRNSNERYRLMHSDKYQDRAIQPWIDELDLPPRSSFHDIARLRDHVSESRPIHITVLDTYTYATVFSTIPAGADDDAMDGIEHVFLLYDSPGEHFMACLNVGSLGSGDRVWCIHCRKLYTRQSGSFHMCKANPNTCRQCGFIAPSKEAWRVHFYGDNGVTDHTACVKCNAMMSPRCIEKHTATCKGKKKQCPICSQFYFDAALMPNNHRAMTTEQHSQICGKGYRWCETCEKHLDPKHTCTIVPKSSYLIDWTSKTPMKKTYVYDIECYRDTTQRNRQKFVYAAVHELLMPTGTEETQEDYMTRIESHLASTDVIEFTDGDAMVEWMLEQKGCRFIAHNAQGYDLFLIYHKILNELHIPCEPVLAGNKVRHLSVGKGAAKVQFYDSLCHYPTSLAAFPKMVGLPESVEKGHFPHEWHTQEHRDYEGPLPDLQYYGIGMSKVSKREMEEWHETEKVKYTPHTETPWRLKEKLREYCIMDVVVLVKCLAIMVLASVQLDNMDPFRFVTMPSYCLARWRAMDMPDPDEHPLYVDRDPDLIKRSRDALHGGRTEVFQRKCEVDPVKDKKIIKVWDVTSLYPSKMLRGYYYPFGESVILVGADIPEGWWKAFKCGLVTVDVEPPRNTDDKVPVLGCIDEEGGRLRFDWFRKKNITITLAEAKRCIEVGYKLYPTWLRHWPDAIDSAFTRYMTRAMEIKTLASAHTEDTVDAVIAHFRDQFGVTLDRAKLLEPVNHGWRLLAKFWANCLWGKFAERERPKERVVNGVELLRLLTQASLWREHVRSFPIGERPSTRGHEAIIVRAVHIHHCIEDAYTIKYEEPTGSSSVGSRTNIPLAAHVTAYGRLEMHKALSDPRITPLYGDTDSVFAAVDAEVDPATGKVLSSYDIANVGVGIGQWTSDLPDNVPYLTHFVCPAPKTYVAKYHDLLGRLVWQKRRAKGFMVDTVDGEELFTYENVSALFSPGNAIVQTVNSLHRRKDGGLFFGTMQKELMYNPTSQKRWVNPEDPDGPMLAFGKDVPLVEPVEMPSTLVREHVSFPRTEGVPGPWRKRKGRRTKRVVEQTESGTDDESMEVDEPIPAPDEFDVAMQEAIAVRDKRTPLWGGILED